ncbi:MAG: metallopeptidase family protein [Elusimicrobia bacterium]|nr:metallopeptidase family protein [Elusimicrobiota bacterium]
MSRARFEALAERALAEIPQPLRDLLYNVDLSVRDAPGEEAGRWRGSHTLLGLYTGLTRGEMLSPDAGTYLPAQVFLYQRNLERGCRGEAELEAAIRTTLRHELAHHFGFTDAELRERWPEGA